MKPGVPGLTIFYTRNTMIPQQIEDMTLFVRLRTVTITVHIVITLNASFEVTMIQGNQV